MSTISYRNKSFHKEDKLPFQILDFSGTFFCFNCEHVLFVYIVKQKKQKICGFYKKNREYLKIFKIFLKAGFCYMQIYENLMIQGSRNVPHKI